MSKRGFDGVEKGKKGVTLKYEASRETSVPLSLAATPSSIAVDPNSKPSYTEDPNYVIDDMIVSKASKLNVCLPYALFNSLRTHHQRWAFAAGNINEPHKAFVDMMHNCQGGKFRKRIQVDGYNSNDIAMYLDYLRRSRFIKEYTWKRLRRWIPNTHLLTRDLKPFIVALFAHATVSDMRESGVAMIKKQKG